MEQGAASKPVTVTVTLIEFHAGIFFILAELILADGSTVAVQGCRSCWESARTRRWMRRWEEEDKLASEQISREHLFSVPLHSDETNRFELAASKMVFDLHQMSFLNETNRFEPLRKENKRNMSQRNRAFSMDRVLIWVNWCEEWCGRREFRSKVHRFKKKNVLNQIGQIYERYLEAENMRDNIWGNNSRK